MLKIYGTEGARSIRPIWVAEELGIEYELEMMPFPPRVLHKEFLEINMLGTVPYLVDGDVRMCGSLMYGLPCLVTQSSMMQSCCHDSDPFNQTV